MREKREGNELMNMRENGTDSNETTQAFSRFAGNATDASEPPLREIGRRQVFREQGGADFTVTAVDMQVKATGEHMTLHMASVKGDRPGAVCVVILHQGDDERYLIARHWRTAIDQWSWEFPRGMGEASESLVQTAARELKEETGIEVSTEQVRPLQIIHADGGVLRDNIGIAQIDLAAPEECEQALAAVPQKAGVKGTDWELTDLRWVSAQELRAAIADSHIIDAITISAFTISQLHRHA